MKKMLFVMLLIASSAVYAWEVVEFTNKQPLMTNNTVRGTVTVVERNEVTYGWVLTQLCTSYLYPNKTVSELAKVADEIMVEIKKRENNR